MSSGKVLEISPDDAKYIDPAQISSIQLVDGTTIVVKDEQGEFVEEGLQDAQQYQTQEVQTNEQGQKLRGRGALGALAGIAAGAALLGTAAAVGSAVRRNRAYGGYGYGYGRPMMAPMRPMGYGYGPRPMGYY